MDPRRRALLAALAAAAAARPALAQQRMTTKPIPSTGEALPVIGVGTWQTFDVGSDATARAPLRQVLKLLDRNASRLLADVRNLRDGRRRPHRRAGHARPALHGHQGLDQRPRGRHPPDGDLPQAPAGGAHGPDAGPQPGGRGDSHRNAQGVEAEKAHPLHRHHALHLLRVRRGRALAENEAVRLPADQLLARRARSREPPSALGAAS